LTQKGPQKNKAGRRKNERGSTARFSMREWGGQKSKKPSGQTEGEAGGVEGDGYGRKSKHRERSEGQPWEGRKVVVVHVKADSNGAA